MFTFFHRKRKVVVDCFTYDLTAYEITPITKARENIPDWWHNLPSYGKVNTIKDAERKMKGLDNNMRRCYGFLELYKRGAIIRNWADTIIEVDKENYRFAYSNGDPPAFHESKQYNNAFENFHHIKLNPPWFFKEKSGIPFMLAGATWNNDDKNITFLHGVTTFDVNATTAINIMMPRKEEPYTLKFNMGHPLIHIIPLRDDLDVSYKCHMTSREYCVQMGSMSGSTNFSSPGIGLINILKKSKQNKSRCPF